MKLLVTNQQQDMKNRLIFIKSDMKELPLICWVFCWVVCNNCHSVRLLATIATVLVCLPQLPQCWVVCHNCHSVGVICHNWHSVWLSATIVTVLGFFATFVTVLGSLPQPSQYWDIIWKSWGGLVNGVTREVLRPKPEGPQARGFWPRDFPEGLHSPPYTLGFSI